MTTSLTGLRVVNTRAVRQAGELDLLLIERGAVPISFPCIELAPPADCTRLDLALRKLAMGHFDWLLLTSVNAVDALSSRLSALDISLPSALPIGVVGSATATALRASLGTVPAFQPVRATGLDLAREVPIGEGDRVMFPASDVARPEGVEVLRRRGAVVTVVTAYRTVTGSGGANLPALLTTGDVDVLTFCSPSAVTGFTERVANDIGALDLARALPTACIGATTFAAATTAGFREAVCPGRHSLVDLVDLLAAMRSNQLTGGSRWH